MNNPSKEVILNKHKAIATGLFFAMVLIYILCLFFYKKYPKLDYIKYIQAFAEAGIVGALADWFAVTALFHKPLGFSIPHTNLIETKKKDIGANLGGFIVDNFLNPKNIRPYIEKIKVHEKLSSWLQSNQGLISSKVENNLIEYVLKNDFSSVSHFVSNNAASFLEFINLNEIVSSLIDNQLCNKEHQYLMTYFFKRINAYITSNEHLIKEKVTQESSSMIPGFVQDIIAQKISDGLHSYFDDIINNNNHSIRLEIEQKITELSYDIKHQPKWKEKFSIIKNNLLLDDKKIKLSNEISIHLKNIIISDLKKDQEKSTIKTLLKSLLTEIKSQLDRDVKTQEQINLWIQKKTYQYILKYRKKITILISNTIDNWEGKELSKKLELEVGKDLQFIRINGTLVGGLVGLLIYTLTQIFS